MAKRGRPPKASEARKGAQLSIRISAELRTMLERAAGDRSESGSLSQEIEARLRSSFLEPQRRYDELGGPTTYWLFRTVAERMMLSESLANGRWFQDPYAYETCLELLNKMVEAFRPSRQLSPARKSEAQRLGASMALAALAELKLGRKIQQRPAVLAAAELLSAKMKISLAEILEEEKKL